MKRLSVLLFVLLLFAFALAQPGKVDARLFGRCVGARCSTSGRIFNRGLRVRSVNRIRSSCAMSQPVQQFAQPIASYGSCQSCQVAGASYSFDPSEYAPQTQQVSYAPTVGQASLPGWATAGAVVVGSGGAGQCRMVNGQWRCGG